MSTPQILSPHVIVVDFSDDSNTAATGATNSEYGNNLSYRDAVALPIPSSSLVIEFNSDPPVTHEADSSAIMIHDSDGRDIIEISDSDEELFDPDTLHGGIQKPGPTPRGHCHL